MLVVPHLFVLEVVVPLKFGVASSHGIRSFQQVVTQETVAGFNETGVLPHLPVEQEKTYRIARKNLAFFITL